MTADTQIPPTAPFVLPPQYRQRATLTIEEAGELLGISRGSAYAAAKSRSLPTVKIGRRLLVPRAALERLLGA